ncbi:MAG: hypothetical protein M1839_004773 [Geoglossum umbratile]|nr:MAG: hypothetical protein M1839_004773 [Geoglossum umbratile]
MSGIDSTRQYHECATCADRSVPREPTDDRFEGSNQVGVRRGSRVVPEDPTPSPAFQQADANGLPPQYVNKELPGGPREIPGRQRYSVVGGPVTSITRGDLTRDGRPGPEVSERYSSETSYPQRELNYDPRRNDSGGASYRVSERYLEAMKGQISDQKKHLDIMYAKEIGYKKDIKFLEGELGNLEIERRNLRTDKTKLSQQVFELGGVEEGVTDHGLKQLYEDVTGQATSQLRKVFGKPSGDDHVRLDALLTEDQKKLLCMFGNSQYHNVMSCALYTATAETVDQRYCVGAAAALEGRVNTANAGTDAQNTLGYLKMLEDALRASPDVPPRAVNIWRSSFMKLLLRLPEVKNGVEPSVGGESPSSEVDQIFNIIWDAISRHIPKDTKPARNAVSKLIKLRIDLSQKIRTSLATYTFEVFKTGTRFDPDTMSIVDIADGDCELKEMSRLRSESRGRLVVVGYCIFPALYKWGNEQGYDLETKHVVRRATVLPLFEDDEFVMSCLGK